MHRIGDIVLIKHCGATTYIVTENSIAVGKILCRNRLNGTHEFVKPYKIIENITAGYRANVRMPHIIQELFLL